MRVASKNESTERKKNVATEAKFDAKAQKRVISVDRGGVMCACRWDAL